MFEEDARDALISYLGYSVKQPEEPAVEEPVAEQPAPVVEQPAPVVAPITAEDLFASAPMKQPEPEPEPEKPVTPEPVIPAMTVKEESAEWREELKQCIIVGDFVNAVATCFKYHQFADAFVIASWGGAELVEQTTVRATMFCDV